MIKAWNYKSKFQDSVYVGELTSLINQVTFEHKGNKEICHMTIGEKNSRPRGIHAL